MSSATISFEFTTERSANAPIYLASSPPSYRDASRQIRIGCVFAACQLARHFTGVRECGYVVAQRRGLLPPCFIVRDANGQALAYELRIR